jgi:hypothetical protein
MYDNLFSRGMKSSGTRRDLIDRKLNRLAQTILLSGNGRFWHAVTEDFLASMDYSLPQMAAEPFHSTDWLKARVGQPTFEPVRGLVTFRNPQNTAEKWQNSAFFQLGTGIPVWSFGSMALACCMALALEGVWGVQAHELHRPRLPHTFLLKARGKETPWPALSFSLALLFTGAALLYANCALTFRGARFVPPTYILFLLAAAASLGTLLDHFGPLRQVDAAAPSAGNPAGGD